jgi:hypothetical protein
MRTWVRNGTCIAEDWTLPNSRPSDYVSTPDSYLSKWGEEPNRGFRAWMDGDGNFHVDTIDPKDMYKEKKMKTATITIKDNKLTVKVKDDNGDSATLTRLYLPEDASSLVDCLRALAGDIHQF